jgi:hypothetical protein
MLQIIPLEQNEQVVGVIDIVEEPTVSGASSLTSGPTLLKKRLPLGRVLDCMSDKYVWHRSFTFLSDSIWNEQPLSSPLE